MDISFGRVKEIAESLPIGFYAKEKIELIVSNDEQVSYYAPLENKIVKKVLEESFNDSFNFC